MPDTAPECGSLSPDGDCLQIWLESLQKEDCEDKRWEVHIHGKYMCPRKGEEVMMALSVLLRQPHLFFQVIPPSAGVK